MRDEVLTASQFEGGLDSSPIRLAGGVHRRFEHLFPPGLRQCCVMRCRLQTRTSPVVRTPASRCRMARLRVVRTLAKRSGRDDLRAFVEAEANRFVEALLAPESVRTSAPASAERRQRVLMDSRRS